MPCLMHRCYCLLWRPWNFNLPSYPYKFIVEGGGWGLGGALLDFKPLNFYNTGSVPGFCNYPKGLKGSVREHSLYRYYYNPTWKGVVGTIKIEYWKFKTSLGLLFHLANWSSATHSFSTGDKPVWEGRVGRDTSGSESPDPRGLSGGVPRGSLGRRRCD